MILNALLLATTAMVVRHVYIRLTTQKGADTNAH